MFINRARIIFHKGTIYKRLFILTEAFLSKAVQLITELQHKYEKMNTERIQNVHCSCLHLQDYRRRLSHIASPTPIDLAPARPFAGRGARKSGSVLRREWQQKLSAQRGWVWILPPLAEIAPLSEVVGDWRETGRNSGLERENKYSRCLFFILSSLYFVTSLQLE